MGLPFWGVGDLFVRSWTTSHTYLVSRICDGLHAFVWCFVIIWLLCFDYYNMKGAVMRYVCKSHNFLWVF